MTDPEKAMDAVDTKEDGGGAGEGLAAELLQNPAVLASFQGRLSGMIGLPSGYIESLPKVVKRRIKALKKLQLEATKTEAKFYEEVHALECKYHLLYKPLYEKRALILKGEHEPDDTECDFTLDDEDEEKISQDMEQKAKIEDGPVNTGMDENTKGIPEFWLTVFKNVDLLAEMIQEADEPILRHLSDVKTIFSEKDPMGFTLEFYFRPNEYFSNTLLTKEYIMKCEPDEKEPFTFEGPEIYKCKGCTIDWAKGKNVTVKTIKKKQKHKSRGATRTVTRTVQSDSFFNFFAPPTVPEDPEVEVGEQTESLLTADFEIGHYIRERIVPRAVLYFTGEALEEDDFEEEEEEDDEEEGSDEMDDEEDPDFDPKKAKVPKGQNPNECKQQ